MPHAALIIINDPYYDRTSLAPPGVAAT
jgi:hypothetical protein